MKIGIVGHEAAKFDLEHRLKAKIEIQSIIIDGEGFTGIPTIISGRCPLGGIDLWAIEEACKIGCPVIEYPPATNSWESGYKPRNIQIAFNSDEVHNIVVAALPDSYIGMKFKGCYHCVKRDYKLPDGTPIPEHIKSGGCWTTWYVIEKFGKRGVWHVL